MAGVVGTKGGKTSEDDGTSGYAKVDKNTSNQDQVQNTHKRAQGPVKGIITLEDVLEELIQEVRAFIVLLCFFLWLLSLPTFAFSNH